MNTFEIIFLTNYGDIFTPEMLKITLCISFALILSFWIYSFFESKVSRQNCRVNLTTLEKLTEKNKKTRREFKFKIMRRIPSIKPQNLNGDAVGESPIAEVLEPEESPKTTCKRRSRSSSTVNSQMGHVKRLQNIRKPINSSPYLFISPSKENK